MPRFSTMPVKHKGAGRKRKRRGQRGGNILGDLWNAAKKGHDYIKDHKLISKGLALIPHPKAQAGSKIADTLGYGRGGVRPVARGGSVGFA